MGKSQFYLSGETTPLPGSHLLVPATEMGIVAKIREHRLRWLEYRGSESYDNSFEARLSMSAINRMLDYYPSGMHRDERCVEAAIYGD